MRSTRQGSSAPDYSPHPTLDCSHTRFVNIGTGARHDDLGIGKREKLADLVPRIIRRGLFLKTALKEIAVNSQKTVDLMDVAADLNPNVFKYERFDADHGVSDIALDRYDLLNKIREKTNLYLAKQSTQDQIQEVGNEIANDYVRSHPINQPNEPSKPSSAVNQSLLEVHDEIPGSSSFSTTQSTQSSDHPDNDTQLLNVKCGDLSSNGTKVVAEVIT